MMVIRLALTLLLALPQIHGAETGEVKMHCRNWTTRDGLPQDSVRAMARTRDGFLWLGTDAGLARFDGFEFKTYDLHDGLGAVAVLALLEAVDGTLWVGTMGGGLSALREGKVVRTYAAADGLPSVSISVLAEDGEGRLWAGHRGALVRLSGDRFEPIPGMPDIGSGWLRKMHLASDGKMWLGFTGPQLWIWKDDEWSRAELPGTHAPTAFFEDDAARLWMGDMSGSLWCRETGAWRQIPLPDGYDTPVSSITADRNGVLWVTWYQRGLLGFQDGTVIRPVTTGAPYTGLEDPVLATPDGLLWLGSPTRGLFALNHSRIEVLRLDENDHPGANTIGALVETAPGEFLIGTQGRGLYRQTGELVERVEAAPHLSPSVFVNAMIPALAGGVWVGTGGGLTRLHGDISEPVTGDFPKWMDVWQLLENEEGLWFGTGAGSVYKVEAGIARSLDFNNPVPVKGMARLADGTLWVGTHGRGLFAETGGGWKTYGKEQGLASMVIRVIHATPEGGLWVGTAGGGLAVKRGDRFLSVSSRDGLPADTISQIHQDAGGRLWLGTHRGLAVLSAMEVSNIKAGKPGRLYPRVIDRFDGLPSEEFTIVPPVATKDGRLAFGTTQGVVILKPEDFRAERSVPPVLIEEVLVDGRLVEVRDGVADIPPGARRVELRFTGLHFAAPDRLRFRNRLAGLEEDWGTPGTARTATYRNVAPGNYHFEVSATTGNGLWSLRPATVQLRFKPQLWQTLWFRAGVVLLALGTVAFAVRRREQFRSARRIEQLERQRAVDGERARIARDLHDDVGASLTQVALLSQLAGSNLTRRPERAAKQVGQIFDTAKEVTRSLDEIVWAVNPQNDTLESFVLFLGAFVQNYSHSAGLRCRVDAPEQLPAETMDPTARHHLYLATKEILHNVAKHAAATEIRLTLALETGWLRLSLADNGCGFQDSAAVKPDADGMSNLKSRLQQLGGTCTRRSVPAQGTTVELRIPLVLTNPA